ncbi:hypothetical protein NITLEN_20073 [Nitrospira lenta]|uniref:Uncharacterized protein n=1 Tax=Nitrospira lenta TaxID=1436998 RepID=A0A330L3N2_9BACT|nr:hypothetical protein NITLEN_20073 [Nitrospira lenta]
MRGKTMLFRRRSQKKQPELRSVVELAQRRLEQPFQRTRLVEQQERSPLQPVRLPAWEERRAWAAQASLA